MMRKEEKIKVVYVEPDKTARIMEIENTLEAMQEAVGGRIQTCHYLDDPVALVCNDDGRFLDIPLNRAVYDERAGEMIDVVPGNFFICYAPPGSEHFRSMPLELLEKYRKKFYHPEFFMKRGLHITAMPMEPEKKKRDRREDRR